MKKLPIEPVRAALLRVPFALSQRRHGINCCLAAILLFAMLDPPGDAGASQLQAIRGPGLLDLRWEAADAKLQAAVTLNGPWQTVNTAAVSVCQTRFTGAQKFYRLMQPAPGKKWLTVAAANMTSKTNTEANLQTFFSYMEAAASNDVDLIVFPEVALQGCPGWRQDATKPSDLERAYTEQTAEKVPGPSTSNLVAKAQELGMHVVFGMTEKAADGKLYNASFLLGPGGVIGTHRKAVAVGNDGLIWSRGTNLIQVIDSPLGKVGMLICAETGGESGSASTLPGRRLAAAGADFIVTASAWWTTAASLYDLATCTNALWSGRWLVIAEQVGMIGHAQCYGHSRIVDPLGTVLSDSGTKQGLIIGTMDIQIDAPSASWFQGQDMPSPASSCASCLLNGMLYVMGGMTTGLTPCPAECLGLRPQNGAD